MIELQNIEKQYDQIQALKDINLKFQEGILGIVGPNGAGKSTLFKIIMGLCKPTAGNVTVFSKNPWVHRKQILKRVGFVGEVINFPRNLTVKKILTKIAAIRDTAPNEAFSIAKKLNLPLKFKVGHLSSGMEKKVNLTVGLVGNPDLVILDEPTASLDPVSRKVIFNIILRYHKDFGTNFLFSSHVLREVEKLCTHVIALNKGTILVNDTLENIFTQYSTHPRYELLTSDPDPMLNFINNKISEKGEEMTNLRQHKLITFSTSKPINKVLYDISEFAIQHKIKIYRLNELHGIEHVFFRKVGEDVGN